MQITRPGLIFGGVASVTAGGVLGSLAASHSHGEANLWIFLAFLTNILVQLYTKRQQERKAREAEERIKADIQRGMRTRMRDFGVELNRIIDEGLDRPKRRTDDF
jgi:uncharacterized membrane protein YfcA